MKAVILESYVMEEGEMCIRDRTNGEPKQGWDHSHEKSYYFINGVSQSGTLGAVSYTHLNDPQNNPKTHSGYRY